MLTYDDIAYGLSLGRTAKFPRHSIAFKWADELRETSLLEIEWSASRTGLINPVAIFEPVELEGTEVERANLHNLSVMKELLGTPYYKQEVEIFKANLIIPQIKNSIKLNEPESKVTLSVSTVKSPRFAWAFFMVSSSNHTEHSPSTIEVTKGI